MASKTRQERIFDLIREIGLSNRQKQIIVTARYNRKHVCHLNADQGADLEQALQGSIVSSPEQATSALAIKQDKLWTDNPLFPVAPEYAKV